MAVCYVVYQSERETLAGQHQNNVNARVSVRLCIRQLQCGSGFSIMVHITVSAAHIRYSRMHSWYDDNFKRDVALPTYLQYSNQFLINAVPVEV